MAERKYPDYLGGGWREDFEKMLRAIVQSNLDLIEHLGVAIKRELVGNQLPNFLHFFQPESLRDFIETLTPGKEIKPKGPVGIQAKNLPGVRAAIGETDNYIHVGGVFASYSCSEGLKARLTACQKVVKSFLLTSPSIAITCNDCLIEINKPGLRWAVSESDTRSHLGQLFAQKTVCGVPIKHFCHHAEFDECEKCLLIIGQEVVEEFLLV